MFGAYSAAREAIGPDIDLMIDANCWLNPHEARLLAQGSRRPCNLLWFEEPIQQNDARALADLRNRSAIPVAAGQMEGHRWRFRELVIHHAVDVIQPNVVYNGGFTETLKVAAHGAGVQPPDGQRRRLADLQHAPSAGLMNGGPVEFHYGMWMTGKHFFEGTPDPVNGKMPHPGPVPASASRRAMTRLKDSRIRDPEAQPLPRTATPTAICSARTIYKN